MQALKLTHYLHFDSRHLIVGKDSTQAAFEIIQYFYIGCCKGLLITDAIGGINNVVNLKTVKAFTVIG